MINIHKAFDALDIAFPLKVGGRFAEELAEVKASLADHPDALGWIQGETNSFTVFQHGARGGFAYMGRFDRSNNIWFLKKPGSAGDTWGLRVSCAALPLAVDGLTAVRNKITEELAFFGVQEKPGTESIGRVDFAMDFLAPEFVLDADQFVMHPRNSRKRYATPYDIDERGRSGRTTSVTIGKNPHRQVIVYDKREEILSKPSHMPILWAKNLERMGLPDINLAKPQESRVWRVEIRFYKEYLKNARGVRTFGDLAAKLPAMLQKTVKDIRYTQPSTDRNRSRWPDHLLWERVREEIDCDFSAIRTDADKETVEEYILAKKDGYLDRQIAGCMLNRAAMRGLGPADLKAFVQVQARNIAQNYHAQEERTKAKLDQRKLKYRKGGCKGQTS
jgi:hypothetical protein